jgi:hypothetical protein
VVTTAITALAAAAAAAAAAALLIKRPHQKKTVPTAIAAAAAATAAAAVRQLASQRSPREDGADCHLICRLCCVEQMVHSMEDQIHWIRFAINSIHCIPATYRWKQTAYK